MLNKKLFFVSSCFGMILMASTAVAGSVHSHAHHMRAIDEASRHVHVSASPFVAEPTDKRLHCELLRHNPLFPCPHHKVPAGGEDECYLTNECGGGPFQAPSSRSVGKYPRFLVPVASVDDDLQITATPLAQIIFYDPFYSHSLDRPPRVL